MIKPLFTRRLLTLLLVVWLAVTAATTGRADLAESAINPFVDTAEGRALHAAWVQADHRFTPEVRSAYLAMARAGALAELDAAGETVPDDFLAWIDSDPVVQSSVYGIKEKPANVLRILRSLEMDLGRETVRKQYTQFALSLAMTYAGMTPEESGALGISLAPRDKPFELVIPQSPLEPVDTKDPTRELDVNDHVINFLIDTPFVYEVKVPADEAGAEPTVEIRSRPMVGADVLQNADLIELFNAYMASHRHPEVTLVYERPNPAQWSKNGCANFRVGFRLFRDAYQAKGLLPTQRDAAPTLPEYMAWYIRNDRFRFPEGSERTWPLVEINAPWPVTTFLAEQRLPLRELEDMWQRWVETGHPLPDGVRYVGWPAQKPEILAGKSISPSEFFYGSARMMVKDGGVCGAQSTTWAHTQLVLGRPATTTRTPTHCGTTAMDYNPETGLANYRGGNTPCTWVMSANSMGYALSIFHHSTAAGLNYGLASYLDSFIAHRLYTMLDETDRAEHGLVLLESGFDVNPYNMLILSAVGNDRTAFEVLGAYRRMSEKIGPTAEGKPGCPPNVLQLEGMLHTKLVSDPLPTDKAQAAALYTYILQLDKPDPRAMMRYLVAVEGMDAAQTEFKAQLAEHLAGPRTPAACNALAQKLITATNLVEDVAQRKAWAKEVLDTMAGQEVYLLHGYHSQLDAVAAHAARFAGSRLAPMAELIRPRLDELEASWRTQAQADFDYKKMYAVAANAYRLIPQLADVVQREQFRDVMLAVIVDRAECTDFHRMIAKAGWTVTDVSRHMPKGLAAHALDAHPGTIWHTYRSPEDQGGLPQHISVDMGEVKTLVGFTYMPRVGVKSAMVDGCAFYTSMDGENWVLATEATFGPELLEIRGHNQAERHVRFSAVRARYFKFVVTHVMENDHLAVAEVGVIETHDASVLNEAAGE